MDKNKIELLILIAIITFGINYGVYSLYLTPQYEKISDAKIKYENAKIKLADLKNKSKQWQSLKEENEKLKESTANLDVMAPKDIDTPRLIYDFYQACNKFGITGEDVSFQLASEKTSDNNKASGSTNQELQLLNLSITLTISGESNKVEEFLKNINTITSRKLNVKSISLSTKDVKSMTSVRTQVIKSQYLSAAIVFTQYIQVDGLSNGSARSYDFYDQKVGFDNISDIFGSYSKLNK